MKNARSKHEKRVRLCDQTRDLAVSDGVPEGYRAMNERETIKVMVKL